MPAYTTISFSFDRPVSNRLVEQFYSAFFNNEIKFKSVLEWGCPPDMTLKEIIEWNQGKIDSYFTPEMDTNISHYERQLCLNVEPFSECRIIINSDEEAVYFNCIVPECEISTENSHVFKKAALRIWDALPVRLTETYDELGSSVGYEQVKVGVQPSVRLFAILDENCAGMASSVYFSHGKFKRGTLLKPNPEQHEPIIVSETVRIARKLGALAGREAFTSDYIANHGVNDAVEQLIDIVNETDVKLGEKDFHQLSFMAYEVGIDFPVEG